MNATATPPSARPPQNPAPRRRWLRRTAIASACVLGLWGVLWLGTPPLIRSQGEKIATNLLGRQVRIGEVKLHPWSLELELRDLSMAGAEPGSAPQLSIARAYVDADMSSLWRLAPVLDAIEIDQPVVRLAHLGEGKLDIADIIARFPPGPNKPDDGGQARLALYNIAITNGRFEFENVPSGGKHVVSDLQLALPFISTLASQRQIRVTPHLSFALDGSRFDTRAHALPFDDSRHTEAALRLAQLDLAPYLPYLPDGLPVRPVAGIADADLRLRFDQSGATPALSIDGTLALSGVKVKDAQEQDAIALERLDVTLQDTRPLERHIHLSQVALTKPDVLLARDARGRINLAATGAAPAKAKAKPAAPAASAASEALPAEAPASEASAAETPAAPAPESAASAPEVADTAALAASSPASSAGDTIDTQSETAPAASEAASAAPAAAPAKAASTRKKATQTKRRTTRKKTVKKKSAALFDALIPAAHAQESEAPAPEASIAEPAPEAAETPDTATLAASSPASSAGDDIDTPQETASSAPAANVEASASAPEPALQAASEPASEPEPASLDTEPASAPQAAPQTTPPKAPKASAAAKPASNAAAASAGEQADWTVQIEQITIADGHLEWRDAQPAASLHANGLTVAARAFTWPLNEPMEFEGSLAVSAPGVATKRAAASQEEAAPQEDAAPAVEPASAAEPAAQPATQPAAKKKATKRRATKKKAGTKKKSAALLDALIPAAHAQQVPEVSDTAALSTSSPASSAGNTTDTPSEATSAASESASEAAPAASAPASAASEAASDASAAEAIAAAPLAPELHESADAAAAAREAATALAVPGEAFKRASGAQTLRFRGSATVKSAQVQAEASNIALALARAYIAPFIKGDIDGSANAHASVQWSAPDALRVNADTITLSHLSLTGEGIAAPVAGQQAAPAATSASSSARDPASPLDHARSGPLVAIERINVEGAALDLAARSVDVQRLAIAAPRAAVLRYADGHLMVQDWLRGSGTAPAASDAAPQEEAPKEKKSAGGTPWSVRLHDAQVQGGLIAWRDAVPTRPVRADLGDVSLKAQGIHWDGTKLAGNMPVELSAQLSAAGRRNAPGRLAWNGKVALAPLAVQGSINAERLPAHAFMPYAGSSLKLDVLRADASFKGNVNVAQQPAGLRVAVHGDARLQELRAHSLPGSTRQRKATRSASQAPLAPDATAERRASGLGEELLSLKNLRVQGVDVQMQPRRPLRVSTGQTTLSDFFARLVILPDGRFSLRDIVGEGEEVPPAAPQAAASAASAAAPAPQRRDPNAPIINIGPVRAEGGRVAFTDRFIRPNYSADLSELAGTLGAFSTAPTAGGEVQMAELKLTGRAQGTALLDISGQLNPLAKPLALDIHGRATDLELPPLSPYSVKYAGHSIERGKLSMDVNYKVQPNGTLTADNKIILNQLEFGEPVEGAPNSLPVKLATALLADSNGVINLDIPVSGSLNDPNFSIAPIIFKAVGSIITGIVTAPFKAIAAALGGSGSAGDPSHVLFASGSSTLTDTARTQLDAVAKMLQERGQLKLTIAGAAQLEAEREGWQRQRLRDMLAAELRGDAPAEQRGDEDEDEGKGGAAQGDGEGKKPVPAPRASADAETDAALGKLGADGYERLLRRLYRRADLPDKPRNALGMARSLPVEEMEKLLMAQIEVDDDAMRTLAQARAAAIKDYLATKGVDGNRLFLGSSRTSAPKAAASAASAAAPAGQLAGAVLSLSTK